jgi:hypothetical protein
MFSEARVMMTTVNDTIRTGMYGNADTGLVSNAEEPTLVRSKIPANIGATAPPFDTLSLPLIMNRFSIPLTAYRML